MLKQLTETGVTPALLDRWAELDGVQDMPCGAGACCLTHQVKAIQHKPRISARPVKPSIRLNKKTTQASERELANI